MKGKLCIEQMLLEKIKLWDTSHSTPFYKLLSKEQKQELKQIIIEKKLHREVGQLSLKRYRLDQIQ